MAHKDNAISRAQAEALFERRERQQADASVAMKEYRAAQQAVLDRAQKLREERLAREAKRRLAAADN